VFSEAFLHLQFVFLFLSKNILEKAARKMLVKLTPVVNFINILQAAFALIFFCQKLPSQTIIREKLLVMLVKLTSIWYLKNKASIVI